MFRILFFSVALLFLLQEYSMCQETEQVELVHANTLEGDEKLGKNVFRLIGNVQFRHNDVLMHCDSAYRFSDENRFDAFGNIHINRGDTVHAYGNLLKYDGNSKTARIFENVRLTDRKMELTTSQLNFNTQSNIADYHTGGKIVDRENVLTSKRGYYFASQKSMYFKDSVVLVNPKYVVECDTLKYNTATSTAFFLGPTTIESKGSDSTFIFCNNGWYNTESGKSYFSDNAFMQSKNQRLLGDSLFYDRQLGIGEALGRVEAFDLDNEIIVHSDYAVYYDLERRSIATGNAVFTQKFGSDSLFLHSDTLLAVWDSLDNRKSYFAFHHVRIFKSDLQGACDSLTYFASDSIIRMYYRPVLWSEQNQMTADTIHLRLLNSNIDKMLFYNSAFIASKVDSLRYNQVRGKNMTGYFKESKLHKIDVEGNGQTIYYVKEKKENSERLTGVNRAECSNLSVIVNESKVEKIFLYTKPEGTLYPINELKPEELKLKGFSWQEEKRPVSREDIFRRTPD